MRVFASPASGPPRRRSSRRPERPGSARGRGGAPRGLTSGRRGRGWPPPARKVSGRRAGAVTPWAPGPAFARASLPRAQPRSRRRVTLTLGPACWGASGRLRGAAGALAPRDRRVGSQGASARARSPRDGSRHVHFADGKLRLREVPGPRFAASECERRTSGRTGCSVAKRPDVGPFPTGRRLQAEKRGGGGRFVPGSVAFVSPPPSADCSSFGVEPALRVCTHVPLGVLCDRHLCSASQGGAERAVTQRSPRKLAETSGAT